MLEEYRKKRDFGKTPEPPDTISEGHKGIFVVQEHEARRLHYDFRIEVDGVLRSWAVPKGPPESPGERRLAVQTEDHPISYADFHGTIPEGEYGAGTVDIWDKGNYVNITIKQGRVQPIDIAIGKGHFLIWVKGQRLRGGFAFQQTEGKNWLMIKMKDEEKELKSPGKEGEILVGGNRIGFSNPEKQLFPGMSKRSYIEYHKSISGCMLPHIIDRPVSMYRFPDGGGKPGFFQKDMPDHFPDWLDSYKVKKRGGMTKYVVCRTEACIVYLATQVAVLHIWTSRIDKLEYPDKMIFDFDPSADDMQKLRKYLRMMRSFLEELGLVPYIMSTGGKGFHIVVPIEREMKFKDVREFAGSIANTLATKYPDDITIEMRKEKRKGKIFIDTYRNSESQTAVAPYSIRSGSLPAVAAPLLWEELGRISPGSITPDKMIQRTEAIGDVWRDFFKDARSLSKVRENLQKY